MLAIYALFYYSIYINAKLKLIFVDTTHDKEIRKKAHSYSVNEFINDLIGMGKGLLFLICDCSSLFCFLLIEFYSAFSIFYIVLTCYAYYYCIWFGFNLRFSCAFSGFLLFSQKGSVTGYDSSHGSFCYSPVYYLSCMHLHSSYYYYDYVVIGVLRPLQLKLNSILNRFCCVLWV